MASRKEKKNRKKEQRRLEQERVRAIEEEKARLEKEEHDRKAAQYAELRQQFTDAGKKYYLVMYDVRGIQNYIYRTAKIKDAIGGSALVADIIYDALKDAIRQVSNEYTNLTYELEWSNDNGHIDFVDDYKDVKVLFIGGGNATVLISSKELAKAINSRMSKYVIEKTYALQLAVAMVEKTDSYSDDYRNLNSEMIRVKENMIVSKPLGALPIMRTEVKTGYPTAFDSLYCPEDPDAGKETRLKKEAAKNKRKNYLQEEKILDSFVTEKGENSTLGFVHIDGNNMGMRIRNLVKDKTTYEEAVSTMRQISYQINHQYKKAFDEMKNFFEQRSGLHSDYEGKKDKYFVMEILIGGDDITYVCNGKIALATVEYYSRKIAKQAMIVDKTDPKKNLMENGFSVCAGIAYAGSHFPFSIAYEVAESCCESAKKAAKENTDNGRVGNWVDFTFCKNVQTQNLEKTRQEEYVTYSQEHLLLRPYFIPVGADYGDGTFEDLEKSQISLSSFNRKAVYFQDEKNIPRSQSKDMRNTYSLGEDQMDMLASFLKSRGRKLPDGDDMYYEEDGKKYARYYDALEMMDMYISLDSLAPETEDSANEDGRIDASDAVVSE